MTSACEIIHDIKNKYHELEETIDLLKKEYEKAFERGYAEGFMDGRKDEHDRIEHNKKLREEMAYEDRLMRNNLI
uniref:Uncharacterized protein n=1 Tax=viral metagenome TaxID=1070528 RepID=A0A6M3M4V8_9ZZZZ